MNAVHPIFAPYLASIALPPRTIEQERIAADLAYNDDKAHRLNNEAFIVAMKRQINDKKGLCGITC